MKTIEEAEKEIVRLDNLIARKNKTIDEYFDIIEVLKAAGKITSSDINKARALLEVNL